MHIICTHFTYIQFACILLAYINLSAICMHNFCIALFLLTFAFTDTDINMHVYKCHMTADWMSFPCVVTTVLLSVQYAPWPEHRLFVMQFISSFLALVASCFFNVTLIFHMFSLSFLTCSGSLSSPLICSGCLFFIFCF